MIEQVKSVIASAFGTTSDKAVPKNAASHVKALEHIGVMAVGRHSSKEDIEHWEDRLWSTQNKLIEYYAREWTQGLLYSAGYQSLMWLRDRKRWVTQKLVSWRVTSRYNITAKAVNVRVSRLTENKPSVTVQTATTDRSDIEKTEYKESLFWYLWDELGLHQKIVRARRWSTKCASGFLKVGWDPDGGCECPLTRKVPRFQEVTEPLMDPATQQPVLDFLQQPVMQTRNAYAGLEEVYVDAGGKELSPVERQGEDELGNPKKFRLPVPENAATYNEGQVFVDTKSPFNIRFDAFVEEIADSWYVQDAAIMPATKILSLWPKSAAELKDARPASDEERIVQWSGLQSAEALDGRLPFSTAATESSDGVDEIDREYLVRETWIFPKNAVIKALWGKKGAKLVTVGGKLLPVEDLPEWALKACPFIQFIDTPEEGNHYGKPPIRDVMPLQDDINRMRSHMAESIALRSRLLLWRAQSADMSIGLLAQLPGAMVTSKAKPEVLELGREAPGVDSFYQASIQAAFDVGNMNDASTGKLPSAGIAAKAIYALQYADERSITEASNLQDKALQMLARAIDAVTRHEYREARKIRIVGEDRSYLVEREIRPEHLDQDVDYRFTPGSMLSRQKESVKNELMALFEAGLIEAWQLKKLLPTGLPDAIRGSNDQHEAKTRRRLSKILNGDLEPVIPDPWDNPVIALSVLEEFMLTVQWETLGDEERSTIRAWWDALKAMQAAAQAPPVPAAPAAPGAVAQAAQNAPIGDLAQFQAQHGAEQLEETAEQAMQPAGVM